MVPSMWDLTVILSTVAVVFGFVVGVVTWRR